MINSKQFWSCGDFVREEVDLILKWLKDKSGTLSDYEGLFVEENVIEHIVDSIEKGEYKKV